MQGLRLLYAADRATLTEEVAALGVAGHQIVLTSQEPGVLEAGLQTEPADVLLYDLTWAASGWQRPLLRLRRLYLAPILLVAADPLQEQVARSAPFASCRGWQADDLLEMALVVAANHRLQLAHWQEQQEGLQRSRLAQGSVAKAQAILGELLGYEADEALGQLRLLCVERMQALTQVAEGVIAMAEQVRPSPVFPKRGRAATVGQT